MGSSKETQKIQGAERDTHPPISWARQRTGCVTEGCSPGPSDGCLASSGWRFYQESRHGRGSGGRSGWAAWDLVTTDETLEKERRQDARADGGSYSRIDHDLAVSRGALLGTVGPRGTGLTRRAGLPAILSEGVIDQITMLEDVNCNEDAKRTVGLEVSVIRRSKRPSVSGVLARRDVVRSKGAAP